VFTLRTKNNTKEESHTNPKYLGLLFVLGLPSVVGIDTKPSQVVIGYTLGTILLKSLAFQINSMPVVSFCYGVNVTGVDVCSHLLWSRSLTVASAFRTFLFQGVGEVDLIHNKTLDYSVGTQFAL
jgi:hypothetical protein